MRHPSKVVIDGCLRTREIAVVIDRDGRFVRALANALSPSVSVLAGSDEYPVRQGFVRAVDDLARGPDAPAVVLAFARPSKAASWWSETADVVLHASSPERANVLRVRSFPPASGPLVIDGGRVRIAGRAA